MLLFTGKHCYKINLECTFANKWLPLARGSPALRGSGNVIWRRGFRKALLQAGLLRAPSSMMNVAWCPPRGGRDQDAENMERGQFFWATVKSREHWTASQEPVSSLGLGSHAQPPGLSVIPLQCFLILFRHK